MGPKIRIIGWALICVLLMFHDSYAQFERRAAVKSAVKALLVEPTTTYIADTVMDKFVNIAHRETMLALGAATACQETTITTIQFVTRYSLPWDCSSIYTVVLKKSDSTEVALSEIQPSVAGKIGEDQSVNFYYQPGDYLVLSKIPAEALRLYVYYIPIARNLDVDTTQLQVARDDDDAVAMYAAMLVSFADRNLDAFDRMFALWKIHVGFKNPPAQTPVSTVSQ